MILFQQIVLINLGGNQLGLGSTENTCPGDPPVVDDEAPSTPPSALALEAILSFFGSSLAKRSANLDRPDCGISVVGGNQGTYNVFTSISQMVFA